MAARQGFGSESQLPLPAAPSRDRFPFPQRGTPYRPWTRVRNIAWHDAGPLVAIPAELLEAATHGSPNLLRAVGADSRAAPLSPAREQGRAAQQVWGEHRLALWASPRASSEPLMEDVWGRLRHSSNPNPPDQPAKKRPPHKSALPSQSQPSLTLGPQRPHRRQWSSSGRRARGPRPSGC